MSEALPPFRASYEVLPPPEVTVVVRPPRRRYALHLLLFVATVLTTTIVGARLQHNFDHAQPAFATEADFFPVTWALQEPSRLALGIPFSMTLMLILLAHEMGHFVYCLRYRVLATLPFFIPTPTLIGTVGAFIRIKSAIRTRAALFDIGIAGPIAGFLVAAPALALGLALSKAAPAAVQESQIQFGYPLIFDLMWRLAGDGTAFEATVARGLYLHPVGLAAWVGMFATALNLLPAGQLDGGHMVYAVWPRAHRAISRLAVLALLPMGYFLWTGWLLWAVLLLFLGSRHPQVPAWPAVDHRRRLLALLAAAMLLLTFVPAPFAHSALQTALHGM